MKKLAFFILVSISTYAGFSQNNTTGDQAESSLDYKSSVLIIPFESKMYLSDIDKDIAQKSELTFHQIKAKFRAALDQNIYIALKKYYTPQSFYSIEPEEAKMELAYIYNSIGYKYEIVPQEEVVKKETVATKFASKFKKKEKEEEYIEAGVRNGEVVSQVDNREKYMKTTLANDKLLPSLKSKYSSEHFIFINELDIKRGANDVYQASEEQYLREIKVHYTIFDVAGNEVSSGAIKSRFPSTQNDIDKIINVQFPMIAERIVSNMHGPDEANIE
jgi:hypothetical protein